MSSLYPTGYTPPYPDNSEGPLLVRTVWTLISISTVVMLARIYSKVHITRRLYWDDALLLLAWACGVIHASQISHAVAAGLGRHMFYLSPEARSTTLKLGVRSLWSSFVSPMLGRMGFCITLLYLTRTDPRVPKWPIYLFLFIQAAVNLSGIGLFYGQCGNEFWLLWSALDNYQLAAKKCMNPQIQTDYGYFMGSINTLTDAFLTALPALLIKHTKLALRTKVGLGFMLCLSVLAMIASIVKTYEARALSEVLDYTHDLSPYIIWISIELNTVIIIASIPVLRPLFRKTVRAKSTAAPPKRARYDSSTVGSTFSRKSPQTKLYRVGSEENIIGSSEGSYQMEPVNGIRVVHEVQVTYEPSNSPFVHAALVGLIQGEIANPSLAKS